MSQAYDWKRFWCPRSGKINLAVFVYLHDPDMDFGRYLNPDLVTFDVISHIPCLALLGEPGIGKSSVINAEKEKIVSKIEENGSKLLWLDLRAYSSEERLIRKLFESPTFQDWTQGDYKLYVFLDSLDECLLRINTLAALLVDELSNYSDKLERLYFRIACRTAEWRSSLEQDLKELWGKDMMGVYELAPLRRVDIASAALAEGIDNNAFLEAIACEAIRKIIRELPQEKDKLRRFLLEAEVLSRRNTWIPPQPSVIIEMTRSQKSIEMQALINHGNMQIIIDSIINGSIQALTGDNSQQVIKNPNTDHKKQ